MGEEESNGLGGKPREAWTKEPGTQDPKGNSGALYLRFSTGHEFQNHVFKVFKVDLAGISQVGVIRDRRSHVWHLRARLVPDFKELIVGSDFLKTQWKEATLNPRDRCENPPGHSPGPRRDHPPSFPSLAHGSESGPVGEGSAF